MKNKIKLLILTLLCIFTFPILVKADMGAPENYKYEVIVTNPNGTMMRDWNNFEVLIPYNTKLTINYETTEKGILYGDVEYEGENGRINLKDTMIFSSKIDFSKLQKNELKTIFYTLEETDMYKGPSTLYGKIDKVKIPADTKVKFEYCTNDSYDPMWIYTEYKGTKGWVYSYSYRNSSEYLYGFDSTLVKYVEDGEFFLVAENVKLYDRPIRTYDETEDKEAKLLGTVPHGYVYKYNLVTSPVAKRNSYYIEYNGKKGWISVDGWTAGPHEESVAGKVEGTLTVLKYKGLEVYESYLDKKPISGMTIPYLSEVKYKRMFCYDFDNSTSAALEAALIEYKGKEYWIKGFEYDIYSKHSYGEYYSEPLEITEEVTLYEHPTTKKVLNISIPVNTEIEPLEVIYGDENDWYFVNYKGKKGWLNSNQIKKDIPEEEEETEDDEEEIISPEKPENNKKDPLKGKAESEFKELTPFQIALISLGSAIILVVTSFVTIILINKKKSSKVEENKVKEEKTEKKNKVKEEKLEETPKQDTTTKTKKESKK